MKLPEFNDYALNIFTDASVCQTKFGESISCSGAIAVAGPINKLDIFDESFRLNRDSTNNNGEIIAVEQGIELALEYRDQFSQINLFSDSKVCIFGLREWIENWYRDSPNCVLIGSQGKPVSNQDMICQCINLILENNLQIALYHQKGHVAKNSTYHALNVFKSTNYIDEFVSPEFIAAISEMNNYVDGKSRDLLKGFEYDSRMKFNPLIVRTYNPSMDIDRYLQLVRN